MDATIQNRISRLVEMGFSRRESDEALKTTSGDLSMAFEHLMAARRQQSTTESVWTQQRHANNNESDDSDDDVQIIGVNLDRDEDDEDDVVILHVNPSPNEVVILDVKPPTNPSLLGGANDNTQEEEIVLDDEMEMETTGSSQGDNQKHSLSTTTVQRTITNEPANEQRSGLEDSGIQPSNITSDQNIAVATTDQPSGPAYDSSERTAENGIDILDIIKYYTTPMVAGRAPPSPWSTTPIAASVKWIANPEFEKIVGSHTAKFHCMVRQEILKSDKPFERMWASSGRINGQELGYIPPTMLATSLAAHRIDDADESTLASMVNGIMSADLIQRALKHWGLEKDYPELMALKRKTKEQDMLQINFTDEKVQCYKATMFVVRFFSAQEILRLETPSNLECIETRLELMRQHVRVKDEAVHKWEEKYDHILEYRRERLQELRASYDYESESEYEYETQTVTNAANRRRNKKRIEEICNERKMSLD